MISLHTIPMKVRNDYCYMRVKSQKEFEVPLICGGERATSAFFEEEMVMQVKVEVSFVSHTKIYNIQFYAMDEFRGKPPMLIVGLLASAAIWESQDFLPLILGDIMDGKFKVENY